MAFNIRRFLSEHGVEYHEKGKNVRHGNINIRCPFCGDDPSWHLGISPEKGVFACWRDPSHKGRLPRLVSRLLGCSYGQAREIVGDRPLVDNRGMTLEQVARGQFERSAHRDETVSVSLPREFRPLWNRRHRRAAQPYLDYLRSRGFSRPRAAAQQYDLYYAIRGRYQGRVLFTFAVHGAIVGWTGRAISSRSGGPRYMNSPVHMAVRLWNYDNAIEGGDLLYIVEGPFDALKIDYATDDSCRAVATLGLPEFAALEVPLRELLHQFKRVRVLWDATVLYGQLEWERKLSSMIGPALEPFSRWADAWLRSNNYTDPGDLSVKEVRRYLT